ncbi:MAG TPA: ADP-ribosylglycohydrolase family protein [Myxococcales bacterium]|nr:ADP-ribosylglycohydrolase family protein [Myxococcales bacterium]
MEPLERARLSLDGLSVGDAFGEQFFGPGMVRLLENLGTRDPALLRPAPWRTTDDTEMACEIVAQLAESGTVQQDGLALRFARRHAGDPARGYGAGAHHILDQIHAGVPWRAAAGEAFRGQGSLGNGGAMRSAPVGAYFAEDAGAVVRHARASAEVTHAHPEGIAGAVAVALAAAWAVRAEGTLFEFVLHHLKETSATRFGLERAAEMAHLAPWEAARELGNGSQVTSADTVPLCLWMASRYLHDYAAALWVTAEQFGDLDTNCAIVGGIVALRSPVPPGWLAAREPLHE